MKKRLQKVVTLGLAVCMAVAMLAGCGDGTGGDSQNPSANGAVGRTSDYPTEEELGRIDGLHDSITVAVSQNIDHLKPWGGTGVTKSYFYWNIFETLYDLDEQNNLVPDIASELPVISDDGLEWTIPIYHTVKDWNGNNLTAADCVAAFEKLISVGENLNYDAFESVEATGEYEITIHWNQKPNFSQYENPLCRTFMYCQADFNEEVWASRPVGTGNYQIISYLLGSDITIWADPNYWALNTDEDVSARSDLHTATVQKVTYKIVSEAASAVTELQAGTVDYCDYISQQAMVDQFLNDPANWNVEQDIKSDYYFLVGNCFPGKPTANKDLRLAIFYALDVDFIAQMMGASFTSCGTIGDPGFMDYDDAWRNEQTYMNTQDIEMAKSYLVSSGFDTSSALTLVYQTGAEALSNAATTIAAQLQQNLGLTINVTPVDNSLFSTYTTNPDSYDLMFFQMGGTNLVGSYKLTMSGVNTVKEGDAASTAYEVGSGYSLTFVQDQELFDLYDVAASTDSLEDIKACIDYVVENAYEDAIAYSVKDYIFRSDIASIYFHETYITPQCFTFN